MTDYQITCLIRLLKRLGFTDEKIAKEYLMHIKSQCFHPSPPTAAQRLRAQLLEEELSHPSESESDSEPELPTDSYKKRLELAQSKEEAEFVADLENRLIAEIQIFNNKSAQYNFNSNEWISVSELSDFAFCPASFSIKRTYNVSESLNMAYGTTLHEKGISRRLLYDALLNKENVDERQNYYLSKWNLLYSGHMDKDAPNFENEKLKIIGQPDYVYIDTYGNKIIVEDKFVFGYNKLKSMTKPYINNRIQVLAYMTYFEEIKSNYGILAYYHYKYDAEDSITGRNIWCTLSSDSKEFPITHAKKDYALFGDVELEKTYKVLSSFLREKKEMPFNVSKLNYSKCMKCSVRSFCVHRTKKHENLYLDYQKHS